MNALSDSELVMYLMIGSQIDSTGQIETPLLKNIYAKNLTTLMHFNLEELQSTWKWEQIKAHVDFTSTLDSDYVFPDDRDWNFGKRTHSAASDKDKMGGIRASDCLRKISGRARQGTMPSGAAA